jgi:hypothetical protein
VPGPPPELRRGRGLSNRASGDLGEELVRRYLASKGYEIVESNYRTRRGELDLISFAVPLTGPKIASSANAGRTS